MTRSTWWGLALILAFNIPLAAFLLIQPGSAYFFTSASDILEIVGPLAVLAWFFVSTALRWKREHVPRAPLLIAAGALSFVIGDIIWAIYEVGLRQSVPFPSLADAGYLTMYPLVAAGLLLLPRRRISALFRTTVLMDAAIIICALAAFSWYFVLGPTIQSSYESLLAQILGSAYPAADLVLVACLCLLAIQSVGVSLRAGTTMLAIGLTAIIASDTAFDYLTLHNAYGSGGISDIGWTAGYMLLGLSAAVLARAVPEAQEAERETVTIQPLWSVLLPYAFLLAVICLMVLVPFDSSNGLDLGVDIGGLVVLILALARQLVVILENHRLIRRQMATEAALRASEEAQRRLALHDTLTGLPNRRLLTDRIEQAIALSRRHRESFAVMLVDLDRFKQVNDQYGHHAGDRLLQHVARRLQGEVRDSDTVARLGGDEFAVLLLDISDTDARAVGEVLVEVLHAPFLLDGPVASIGGSVGVAMFPRDGDDYQTLMQHADDAMYLAKRSRTGVALYDPERPDDTISILNIS